MSWKIEVYRVRIAEEWARAWSCSVSSSFLSFWLTLPLSSVQTRNLGLICRKGRIRSIGKRSRSKPKGGPSTIGRATPSPRIQPPIRSMQSLIRTSFPLKKKFSMCKKASSTQWRIFSKSTWIWRRTMSSVNSDSPISIKCILDPREKTSPMALWQPSQRQLRLQESRGFPSQPVQAASTPTGSLPATSSA